MEHLVMRGRKFKKPRSSSAGGQYGSLAAELLRIHDLIAAEPEPRKPEDWDRIVAALRRVTGVAGDCQQAARDPQPRMVDGVGLCSVNCPLFNEHAGYGSVHAGRCGHGDGHPTRSMVPCRPWVGEVVEAVTSAADWREKRCEELTNEVDTLRRELAEERAENDVLLRRAVGAEGTCADLEKHAEELNLKLQEREADAGQFESQPTPAALPCEHFHQAEPCGDFTIARNKAGRPLCRAHGGSVPGEVMR
jgi:hypothetical protein